MKDVKALNHALLRKYKQTPLFKEKRTKGNSFHTMSEIINILFLYNKHVLISNIIIIIIQETYNLFIFFFI